VNLLHRAGNRTADNPDTGKQDKHGRSQKTDDKRDVARGNTGALILDRRLFSRETGKNTLGHRLQRGVGFRNQAAAFGFLEACVGIEPESVTIDLECVHDPHALNAGLEGLLDQRREGLAFLTVGFDIFGITAQDEILLVTAQHQHAGADIGIVDRFQLLFDRMHGAAHSAFKTAGWVKAEILVVFHQSRKTAGIEIKTALQRIEIGGKGRCSAAAQAFDRSRCGGVGGLKPVDGCRVLGEQELLFPQQRIAQIAVHMGNFLLMPGQAIDAKPEGCLDVSLPEEDAGDDENAGKRHEGEQHHALGDFEMEKSGHAALRKHINRGR
jgi:hypothetical protein